jgi:hypothetical protein
MNREVGTIDRQTESQHQQLIEHIRDLQDKDALNKQLIQQLLKSIDTSKANNTTKAKLKLMETAHLQLK